MNICTGGTVVLLPLDEGAEEVQVVTERAEGTGGPPSIVNLTITGGAYFETMGIDLDSGRLFEANDYTSRLSSVIISSATAERLWH